MDLSVVQNHFKQYILNFYNNPLRYRGVVLGFLFLKETDDKATILRRKKDFIVVEFCLCFFSGVGISGGSCRNL
jgi:hypothetical protein